ncbi:hypothetical protein L150_03776 [Candida albicans Ca529L]|uniref:SelT/selW/selH selenoprotein domain-containing protein n=1 Tax=Candida albicans (strain WO-1) TaxID=294748 RepID=C4YGQ2_CANAW|nr:conserved hypothetical protein [Candida albicans WO-1]RLP65011.1 hypothetical protein L150_03776 [Candida albicans Ca529L]
MSDPTQSSTPSSSINLNINKYPRIIIQYCHQCKWQNRAIWYLQEFLQTFASSSTSEIKIYDISIQPIFDFPGIFQIILQKESTNNKMETKIIYRRKFKNEEKYHNENQGDFVFDGFPDSKFLKKLIKMELGPELSIGHHLEKYSDDNKLYDGNNNDKNDDCKDCKLES